MAKNASKVDKFLSCFVLSLVPWVGAGNTEGGSITVPLTSCLTAVLQVNTKIVSCHTAVSKQVKQEVNGTVILPPSVFPARNYLTSLIFSKHKHSSLFLF